MADCYIRRRKHTGSEPPVSIVSWQNGTDAEIVAMVEAANAGKIKLSDYWNVGDKRVIHLSQMADMKSGVTQAECDAHFVLMHNGLYKDANDKTVNFVVGMDETLKSYGPMNTTNTNAGSWDSCPRRTWCNNTFRLAIPSTIRPIFRQFKTLTATENDSSTLTTSLDYFAFFAEKEIGGATSSLYSPKVERDNLTAIEYYDTSANCNKIRIQTDTTVSWWLRSPRMNSTNQFCRITNSGSRTCSGATTSLYISPFGCI